MIVIHTEIGKNCSWLWKLKIKSQLWTLNNSWCCLLINWSLWLNYWIWGLIDWTWPLITSFDVNTNRWIVPNRIFTTSLRVCSSRGFNPTRFNIDQNGMAQVFFRRKYFRLEGIISSKWIWWRSPIRKSRWILNEDTQSLSMYSVCDAMVNK